MNRTGRHPAPTRARITRNSAGPNESAPTPMCKSCEAQVQRERRSGTGKERRDGGREKKEVRALSTGEEEWGCRETRKRAWGIGVSVTWWSGVVCEAGRVGKGEGDTDGTGTRMGKRKPGSRGKEDTRPSFCLAAVHWSCAQRATKSSRLIRHPCTVNE